MRPYFPEALKYLLIEVSDDTLQNLIRQFPTVKSFIDQAISEGGRVLIHCESGISRAPAFVVAYVMETMGLSYQIAFNYVQSKRFCINPSNEF
ncbi:hypothetical protein K7432_010834 [Basidiobolus ranarum]|uniref:Protein-tyrosine-phosphatase n=1 Tax=Basidiobolus ranarum TaxID=34480 RepID=A0ABR2VUZ5_9FUNG